MSITLASQSLPDPNSYRVEVDYRGNGATMASGAVKFDLVSSTAKHKFTLGWVALTTAQRATLETAWASLKTATGGLTDYDSGSYTVTRDPAMPGLSFTSFPFPGGARHAVTISLIEV